MIEEELRKNPAYCKVMDGMYTKFKDVNDFIVFDEYAEISLEDLKKCLEKFDKLRNKNVAQQ